MSAFGVALLCPPRSGYGKQGEHLCAAPIRVEVQVHGAYRCTLVTESR
jgi:hypothetical protein